jgi:hypothetical protein
MSPSMMPGFPNMPGYGDAMSTLMQPSGPLPTRVYWVRRLLLLLSLILLVAIVSWLVSRATASGDAATKATSGSTQRHGQTSKKNTSAAAGTKSTGVPIRGPAGGSAPPQTIHPATAQPTTTQPPAAPTGACDVADVGIAIHVPTMRAGDPTSIKLALTGESACRLSISARNLVMQVTSGSDRIWSSDDCPNELSTNAVVIRPDTTAHYEFRWDGFRSSKHCGTNVAMAKPGGYWVRAAFLGGDPTKAYFEVKPGS